jgi:UDP-N-acetylmuramoyl-L-alanyl-D-glutamate--2,6-diaminopimelate ligase
MLPEFKHLSDLIKNLNDVFTPPGWDATITGVVMDSRQVKPGELFIAVIGERTDGHRYIPDAIQRGAKAVVGTQALADLGVPYIRVKDSRNALANLAAAFYGFPARKLVVIGVTGTDGKTTTANLIYSILKASGIRVGMVTTVNAVIGGETLDTGFHVTTPESPDVQRYLSQMVSAGLTHVILEATSHGLAQQRLVACEFDMGVVTNITHEHLDFHGTYEAYRASKGKLFVSLANTQPKKFQPPRGAVLNYDDGSYEYLSQITQVKQLSYGLNIEADVHAEYSEDLSAYKKSSTDEVVSSTIHQPVGLNLIVKGYDLSGKQIRSSVSSHLEGEHNVYNCLAAISLTLGVMMLDPHDVERGISSLENIPGRMERIYMGQNFIAMVDFAHTPNALRNALKATRWMTAGRVIAVFGSAGLRDRAKRRLMAETSAELADLTILTAEDPRTESLEDILAEMALGMESRGGIEGETFWRIPDRREALRFSIGLALPGELVIACGKGHEQSMCFEDVEYPWDDRVAMRAALSEALGVPGPEMPFLPT